SRDRERDLVFGQERLKGFVAHLLDLLAVGRVDLAPDVDGLGARPLHLAEHGVEGKVAVEGGGKDVADRETLRLRRADRGGDEEGGAEEPAGVASIHGDGGWTDRKLTKDLA